MGRGIVLDAELTEHVLSGTCNKFAITVKTKYRVGEIVFLKEPYSFIDGQKRSRINAIYKYDFTGAQVKIAQRRGHTWIRAQQMPETISRVKLRVKRIKQVVLNGKMYLVEFEKLKIEGKKEE